MKMNKQIIIILIVLSLLLSALGGVYYFYIENEKSIKVNNQLRVVYIASRDIERFQKISKDDIKQMKIAKKYILGKPLFKKEIIGKFAKEAIFKNDTFGKNKLLGKIVTIEKRKNDFIHNSYNISFKLFRNPNYSLKRGDLLNIISVYPSAEEKSNKSPNSVQYVVNEVKVLGFLSDGNQTNYALRKVEVVKTVKKKKVKQVILKRASEVLLDIDSKVLLSLIDDYNRGNQLWMVKTKRVVKKTPKVDKKVAKKLTKKDNKKKVAKRSYPTKLYKARNYFTNVEATIHYSDEKDPAITNKRVVKVDMQKECKKSEKYLLGVSSKVYLRSGPSIEYKIKRIVYSNYIIPYKNVSGDSWYLTCDGWYVHKNEAMIISKENAFSRLGK